MVAEAARFTAAGCDGITTSEVTNDGVCCGRGEAVEGCHGEEEGKRRLVVYTTILSLLIQHIWIKSNLQAVLL